VKFSDPDGFLIGRIIPNPIASKPGMIPYFYVNEIDEAAKRVADLGGRIVEAPYAQGNLRVAVVSDPAGNVIGLWQAATP
jgi:predicted enzyme related to lactoylglutathione lyase